MLCSIRNLFLYLVLGIQLDINQDFTHFFFCPYIFKQVKFTFFSLMWMKLYGLSKILMYYVSFGFFTLIMTKLYETSHKLSGKLLQCG